MKHLLFILIAFCINVSLSKAQSLSEFREITLQACTNGDRETKDKDHDIPVQPQTRGLISQSAYAYLYNNAVNIDFTEMFPIATVTIINESTGETVYSMTYNNPVTVNINLNDESNESYFIEIDAGNIYLKGTFSL